MASETMGFFVLVPIICDEVAELNITTLLLSFIQATKLKSGMVAWTCDVNSFRMTYVK